MHRLRTWTSRRHSAIALAAAMATLPPLAGAQWRASSNQADVAVAFVAERSLRANIGQNFYTYGGAAEIGLTFFHGFGAAANVSGGHAGSIGSSGLPLSVVTTTFGPRYRWTAPTDRFSVYGDGLVGEANAFNSLFPGTPNSTSAASSFAAHVGGGVDVKLRGRISVRAVEAAWVYTQLPNSTDNRQNNLQLGAGVVLRFSR